MTEAIPPPERPRASRGSRARAAAPWLLVGEVVGAVGLALSYVATGLMNLRLSPVSAMAEYVIAKSPGAVVRWAERTVETWDKPLLMAGILLVLVLTFALLGLLLRRSFALALIGFALLAVPAVIATLHPNGATSTDLIPIVVGYVGWVAAAAVLRARLVVVDLDETDPDDDGQSRRTFLMVLGGVAGAAGLAGIAGRIAGAGRRRVEEERRLLRLPGSQPSLPRGTSVSVRGVAPWQTPNGRFYLIDTAAVKPAIENSDWSLRIHGMVERELTISFRDLVGRDVLEDWITLNCVSNEVGGDLIGNAWWTGTSLAALIREAGPTGDADALLQTSEDGWTCGTPLETVLDGRNAMLAYAMNGQPLPIDHGYPVRTVVPGLYGYVSATKWVVDIEITRFSEFTAFWTDKGWSEKGPVRLASRIDVPRAGDEVHDGDLTFAGSAWCQHTGISAVEIQVDGGAWTPAELGRVPSSDTWVQWRATTAVEPGRHEVRVRATDADGVVQTGELRAPAPNGATGWHTVGFSAR